MEKPKPMFGKLIQKKMKGRGIFSKNDKSPNDFAGTLANERTEDQDHQPMDYSDHNNPTTGTNDIPYTPSPSYSKTEQVRQNIPMGQEYWHPIYVSTPSERSSSAPVSPVSVYDSPTPLLEHSRLPINSFGQRQPPPVTIYRSNRSRGMRWKPPVTCRRGLSPHQSEMSLSAPSSPGNGSSCYEQVPMDGFENTEDDDTDYDRPYRRPWASNFEEAFRQHRHLRFYNHTNGHSHHHRGHNSQYLQNQQQIYHGHGRPLGETQDLLALLKKLGLESLHQRLLQNGFSRIDQLGSLTRQRLIDMGVESAEVQASLLTAAQLLTNSRIETPVCSLSEEKYTSATWNRTNFGLYASGDIIFPRSSDYWSMQGNADLQGQETDPRQPQSTGAVKNDNHELHFGVRKHFPGIPRNDSLASQRLNSLGTNYSGEFKIPPPPRMFDKIGNNMGSLQKDVIPEEYPIGRPKTPVGILRKTSEKNQSNGEANRFGPPDLGRKRTGSTPKSVKIDESSLQHQNAQMQADNLEAVVAERLRIEWIDLTKAPYTNSAGESGIPIRLVERYAEETGNDFMEIALVFESLRERALRIASLPFVSNPILSNFVLAFIFPNFQFVHYHILLQIVWI
ncbi:unnamed protein product [Hymenolepis diminuta]|uniref:SAM domain-containing protein n=1 Tax=Hymenolepis diminuta TaxID=6216 RepID=A0A158QDI1_HYMDI|nr:unnamed protein product [Hymenolepis diminuta]